VHGGDWRTDDQEVAGGPRRTPLSHPRSHPPHSNQQRAHLG
jgi:hypothetical protein